MDIAISENGGGAFREPGTSPVASTPMRIVLLTAGTGSFYCGTCMRDNALVRALKEMGHDAVLVPMYLPMMLDEELASPDSPIFYGGINVYLQQTSGLFRKTPRFIDRLLDSSVALGAAARKAGMTSPNQLGEITLSMLKGEEGNQVKELDRLVAWLQEVTPDVVCLSNALLLGLARRIKDKTGAVVVGTLQGEDSYLDSLPEPFRTDCWREIGVRGSEVEAHIAVSKYYGDLMWDRASLPADKIHVVYNGISVDGFDPAPSPPKLPTVGYLARMCPAKGLHTLIDAFLILLKRQIGGLQLHVGGSMTTGDMQYVGDLQDKLPGGEERNDVAWSPDMTRQEKLGFLKGLSVLSVPATYGESFGLYVIESLAAGVPVVQPRSGAFPELIEATGGGLLCKPDDPLDLADKLQELLADPARARAMGEQGMQAVRERFSVQAMARGVMEVFEKVMDRRRDAVRV